MSLMRQHGPRWTTIQNPKSKIRNRRWQPSSAGPPPSTALAPKTGATPPSAPRRNTKPPTTASCSTPATKTGSGAASSRSIAITSPTRSASASASSQPSSTATPTSSAMTTPAPPTTISPNRSAAARNSRPSKRASPAPTRGHDVASSSHVLLKPSRNPPQTLAAVLRPTRPAQPMRLALESHQLHGPPQHFQHREELMRLLDWAAMVLLLVLDQQRCADILCIRQRRQPAVQLAL